MKRTMLVRFLALFLALAVALPATAAGPKFQVLHTFAGGASDGSYPISNLLIDRSGDLFGMTEEGGSLTDCFALGCGTAFELSNKNGRWIERVLFDYPPTFNGGIPNGGAPFAVDAHGNLYSTQNSGGDPVCNCGVVYQLSRVGGVWTQTVLHTFTGGTTDGAAPYSGLVRDSSGNLYGATSSGGLNGYYGTLFRLAPNPDGTWAYSVIYNFGASGYSDAGGPLGPLIIDSTGAIYGTTSGGGSYSYGTVFKASQSNGVWSDTVLSNFTLDYGSYPYPAGVVADAQGNLYGVTYYGGPYGVGTIYKLSPARGFWNKTVIHTFTGGADGADPYGGLAIDGSGVLYGTAEFGGSYGYGNVYKLELMNGKWKQTLLHAFTNGSDGQRPYAGVILDSLGNLYGTTLVGGTSGFGVAFEITP